MGASLRLGMEVAVMFGRSSAVVVCFNWRDRLLNGSRLRIGQGEGGTRGLILLTFDFRE